MHQNVSEMNSKHYSEAKSGQKTTKTLFLDPQIIYFCSKNEKFKHLVEHCALSPDGYGFEGFGEARGGVEATPVFPPVIARESPGAQGRG